MDDLDTTTPRERITIRTVAADAGVSVAAVSKVLRDAYGVSDALRQKVLESIEKLGYRPSVAARAMRGQTYTVGILLVEMANPFLPALVDGMNAVLGEQGYKVHLAVGRAEENIEASMLESMIDHRMDGLLLVAPRMSGAQLDRFARQIPIVAMGHHEGTATSFDTVNCDDEAGGRLAVQTLVAAGHRDIAMLSLASDREHPSDVYTHRERGYRAAMAEAGLSDRARVIHGRVYTGAQWGLEQSLDELAGFSAVFCWSDLHAVGLLNIARMRGLRVPEDLAILSFDNTPVASLPLIGLTSIDQQPEAMGKLSAQLLLSRIRGRTVAQHHLLEPVLFPRTST